MNDTRLQEREVALLSGAPQGGRSPTGEAPESSATPLAQATTEVVPAKARRRQFSPSYKRRIVRAAEACKEQPGGIGRLLRREGLYSSHLTHWRAEIAAAEHAALSPKARGPKPDPARADAKRVAELERENERLKRKLGRAQAVIEVQKKLCDLLGITPDEEVTP